MNLTRRTITLLLFACTLMIAAVGTASASETIPVTLNSPAHHGTVSSPTFSFSWSSSALTADNVLTIRSTDGLQKISFVVPGYSGACTVGMCSFMFLPQAEGWTWREGVEYKWTVKIKSGGATVGSSSAKFTVDMLPSGILLNGPSDDLVNGATTEYFIWDVSDQLAQYRLIVTGPNGFKQTSGWLDRATACNALTCMWTYAFDSAEDGAYTWRVTGRQTGVTGKAKSEKRALIVND